MIVYSISTKSHFFNIGKRLLALSSNLLKDINESINNIIQIKLLKKENYFEKRFDIKVKENSYKVAHLAFLQSLPRVLVEFIAVLILFSIFLFLFSNSYSKEETTSILTLFAIAVLRIYPFSIKLIAFINSASTLFPTISLLKNEIFKIDDEGYDKKSYKINEGEFIKNVDQINLESIDYFYPNTKSKLLENINLELKKDNIYGIFGSSGSGKTTLLNLICGLIKPTKGRISYDNMELNSKMYPNISYVSQSSFFTNDTIKNNIAFGLEGSEIDEKKFMIVLKKLIY